MALLEKAPADRVILGTFPDNWKRCPCTSQLVSERHLSALAWPLTGACEREQGGTQAGTNQSVLQGWFHLVTPNDSTLCTERIKVFGGVRSIFYLVIILRRKA